MSEVRTVPVHPSFLDDVWDDVVRFLGPSVAVTNGKFSMDSVRAGVLSGDLVLWAVFESGNPVAFYTTRLIVYPNRKAMAVDWVGGTGVHSWMNPVLDAIEGQARRNGCAHLEGYGRKAWGRLLQRRGWKPEYVAYRMELGDE
jgi:hypothetical protein